MATAGIEVGSATTFLVDGKPYGGGPVPFTMTCWAGAGFTADADRVAKLLPSPDLHPLRWFNGRAVVFFEAWDGTMAVGDLPPVRHGGMQLLAMATYGQSAAPPVLPVVGQMLPVVGDSLARRYGLGFCTLALIVTNRVAGELSRVLFGDPASLGQIRREQGRDALRFSATDESGGVVTLEVPTGQRGQPVDSISYLYSVQGTDLFRRSQRNVAARQSMRLGSSSARLNVGQHEWAQLSRELGMAARPAIGLTQTDASVTVNPDLERVGVAQHLTAPNAPIDVGRVQAPFVIATGDRSEEMVDQELDRLPFAAAGTFEAPPQE